MAIDGGKVQHFVISMVISVYFSGKDQKDIPGESGE